MVVLMLPQTIAILPGSFNDQGGGGSIHNCHEFLSQLGRNGHRLLTMVNKSDGFVMEIQDLMLHDDRWRSSGRVVGI